MTKQIFSYEDIYLIPNYSRLESRSLANPEINFLGKKFKLPVIPANMEDVISIENAVQLATNGYFYIMHRFKNQTELLLKNKEIPYYSISVGVTGESKSMFDTFSEEVFKKLEFITIDVAHGHHKNVKEMIEFLNSLFSRMPRPKIIAGNVATADGYKFLCDLGVDAVKVGIGGGSICTTRYKTGFHLPTAYSVYKCAETYKDIPIIADGGAKHYGDIAKALTLGADMVMSGGWFASCIDSPAQIVHGKKIYRGSTSFESKGKDAHIEGKTIELEGDINYMNRMRQIKEALCSSISYAGGSDLQAFNYVQWKSL